MAIEDEIKVPRHSSHSKVERALKKVPMDGAWHRLFEMGMSSAEQTARSYNVEGASWLLGYTYAAQNGGTEVKSILWAKWVG